MNPRDVYNTWCNRTDLTDSERAELAQIATDELAITKAFGAKLHFGTAGLRGIMSWGQTASIASPLLGQPQGLPNGSSKPTTLAAPLLFLPTAALITKNLHAQLPRYWQATALPSYFGTAQPQRQSFLGVCVIFMRWQGL